MKTERMLSLLTKLLNYTITHGYPLDCWKTVTNLMLEKDPGQPKIHRLRVIHVIEANYNAVMGIKWREIMHTLEDNTELHDEQYGSRNDRRSLDPVLIQELEFDIIRSTRQPTMFFTMMPRLATTEFHRTLQC